MKKFGFVTEQLRALSGSVTVIDGERLSSHLYYGGFRYLIGAASVTLRIESGAGGRERAPARARKRQP